MAVIAEFRLTDGDLPMLSTLTEVSGVTVTLDTMVPLGRDPVPYVWVEGDSEQFEHSLQQNAKVESIAPRAEVSDRKLYRIKWGPAVHETVDYLGQSNLTLLEASGDESGWRYRLRFPSHGDVAEYMNLADDAGLDVQIRRLVNSASIETTMGRFDLSRKQREAIELAVERGYFDTPREVTLSELATELEISQQALSNRIRRGVHTLVTHGLRTRE